MTPLHLKILAVDDEIGMCMAVSRVLHQKKDTLPGIAEEVLYEVRQAGSGEEALDIIHAWQPDIVLLDHQLPGISGLDVLEELAKTTNDFLVVMVTAYASLETAVKATKLGSYDFLAKPFTPEELRVTVRKTAKNLILQRQAQKHAEEKRQVRFQFISVLAHELKAPLAAIEGYLRIFEDFKPGDDMEAFQQMVGRSLVRLDGMRKLIVDLLDLTHIESGKKSRELSDVDIREVTLTAMETSLSLALEKQIDVRLHADASVMMKADRGEIEIIMNNLITNSIKYNRQGGKVDIRIENKDGTVSISVADTGIGMSKEEADKLFVEFYRVKNSKTKNILGSGLGLAIVKKLALLYEGDVIVESVPDVGTTFTVSLQHSPVL
jgi:two-component system, sensor histidine kinase and response regulator